MPTTFRDTADVLRVYIEPCQRFPHADGITRPGRVEPDATPRAVKQLAVEQPFQLRNLAADSTFGERQLFGGSRKITVTGGRLERQQRRAAGNFSAHKRGSLTVI